MSERGWKRCEDCGEWLQTTLEGVVCFECADSYGVGGDAVFLIIDTARHVGVYPTKSHLEEAESQDTED